MKFTKSGNIDFKWIRKISLLALPCLIFIFFFVNSQVTAQVYIPFFKSIRTEQGLSHNKVNRIMEDSRGFIWIGTEDGLNRYDGRYFKIFRRSENGTSGISGNIINDIFEDTKGVIWIATADGGLTRYDYRLEPKLQFKQYKFKPNQKFGITENSILRIVESNGCLWLATSKSYVLRFNKSTERFDVPVKIGTQAILSLLNVGKDTLLVGRAGGGILRINTKNLSAEQDERYMDLYTPLPHGSISGMFRDRNRNLWIGSWDNKLYRYPSIDLAEGKRVDIPYAHNDEFIPYAQDNYGQIWMGSKNSGLTITGKNDTHYNYRYNAIKDGTIANDHINHIFISRSGIVWVGTNNGLSTYNPLFSTFQQYKLKREKKDITVNDFYKDQQNKLWIATTQGLFVKSPNSEAFENRKLSYQGIPLNISKIFVDVDGTFYLGSDYTLFIYDRDKNKLTVLPNTEKDPVMKKIISSRVVSIVRDTIGQHPVLIVSPYGHYFSYYDLHDKKWVTREDVQDSIIEKYDIRDNLIGKFVKSSSGKLLMATNKYGLGEWDANGRNKIKYFGSDETNYGSLRTSHVFDILQDSPSGFWITTYGGGLNYFDRYKGQFKHIQESSNLAEGLQKDYQGNLWIIANGYINRYDRKSKIYSFYDLPGLKQAGGIRGYIYRDDQGKLYAGGTNTFVVFDPKQIAKIENEPRIFLTDFQIFNTSYSQYLSQKTIKLDHEQNYFSIEYSAPDFTSDNVFYSYKLEGFDKNWTQAGKRNFANYANLPGGKYVFKVRATNWKTDNIQHFASVEIEISPPFWLEWWFYVLVVTALVMIGLAIYFFRIGEIIKRQGIRNGIAQDLHDHVGSTLSSILIYTAVARNHHKNERPAQVNGVLENIEDASTEMISEMADIVWAINPKNDHLYYIVDRIKSYALPLCRAIDVNFSIVADDKILNLALDMKARKNLYLLLKESLNNAIKYSACKNIKLSIQVQNKSIHLQLSDDGIGFSPQDADKNAVHSLSGNGLKNLRDRADEFYAKLEIISELGKGTTISLVFPVSN